MNRREFIASVFQSAALATAIVYCPKVLIDLPKLAPKVVQKALGLGGFEKFTFPIIRRVYPALIADEICKVQPMSGPVSQIFYLDYMKKKPWWKRMFKRKEQVIDGCFGHQGRRQGRRGGQPRVTRRRPTV